VREHQIVLGLGFGDEGKGTVTDHLCGPHGDRGGDREVKAVIRFNGGAQAAHNVVMPDGRHHTFSQFGSGSFWGTPTFLSRFMMVDPGAFWWEKEHLKDLGVPTDRVTVDPECLVTTPYHRAVNIGKEKKNRHGSCGAGIGETQRMALKYPETALRVKHIASQTELTKRIKWLEEWAKAKPYVELDPAWPKEVVECIYRDWHQSVTIADDNTLRDLLRAGPCVFEGAQGVLLDEDFGFHPYTTWSRTTDTNAQLLLMEARQAGEAKRIGVIRTVTTRHGPGPFPSEAEIDHEEEHNQHGDFQGPFRFGHLDLVAHAYAARACDGGSIDAVAVTHVDKFKQPMYVVVGYETGWTPELPFNIKEQELLAEKMYDAGSYPELQLVSRWDDMVYQIELALKSPIELVSYGPTTDDKKWGVD
jgi:adenylosuccinate synthase